MMESKVVVVAVAVIARIEPALSLLWSKDALSLMNEGRKLCDLQKSCQDQMNMEMLTSPNDSNPLTIQIYNVLHQSQQEIQLK